MTGSSRRRRGSSGPSLLWLAGLLLACQVETVVTAPDRGPQSALQVVVPEAGGSPQTGLGPMDSGVAMPWDAQAPGEDAGPDAAGPDVELDCADFRAHGKPEAGDDTPFDVPVGESYRCFYFTGPWLSKIQGSRIETLDLNTRVVHHMLLYTVSTPHADGEIENCIGIHTDGTLVPAFGLDTLPDDVGFEIEAGEDRSFLLEIHYLNTEAGVKDRTGLRVCANKTPRPRNASLTWLGTETILLPGSSLGQARGMCTPARAGLIATEDIELYTLIPHMHTRGRRTEVIVHRSNGSKETLLDVPYDYNDPLPHPVAATIRAGDRIETVCHYQNTDPGPVLFGAGLDAEMCYVFALASPARALSNPGLSIVGASDTCFR